MRIMGTSLATFLMCATVAAAPALTVDQDVHDFGEVLDGMMVVHAYTFTNTGEATLTFPREPALVGLCPCATVDPLPQHSLEPGESLEFVARFDSTGYGGTRVQEVIIVYSDDPGKPERELVLRGSVLKREPHQGSAQTLWRSSRLIVDLREREYFQQGHLLGAINVPYSGLSGHLEDLPTGIRYYLYDTDGSKSAAAAQEMREAGFMGTLALSGGLVGWWEEVGDTLFQWAEGVSPTPPEGAPQTGRYSVAPGRLLRGYLLIVDVRSPEEFASGHIPGAINVPAEDVLEWAERVPTQEDLPSDASVELWLLDAGDGQACRLTKELQAAGHTRTLCVVGGFAQWEIRFGDELLWSETPGV